MCSFNESQMHMQQVVRKSTKASSFVAPQGEVHVNVCASAQLPPLRVRILARGSGASHSEPDSAVLSSIWVGA